MPIVIIGIFHCCVITHRSRDVVGSVGVVDVNLGVFTEVSDPFASDQTDEKGDQKCQDKDAC